METSSYRCYYGYGVVVPPLENCRSICGNYRTGVAKDLQRGGPRYKQAVWKFPLGVFDQQIPRGSYVNLQGTSTRLIRLLSARLSPILD